MVAERAARTTSFIAMDVLAKANELDDVVHLEVGEPDFDPPDAVFDACVDSMRSGNTGYTEATGKPALRSAISDYYDRQYGVDVPPERIIVTPGSSTALYLALVALVDTGERVVLTDPHYACYPNYVELVGGEVEPVSLRVENGFTPVVDDFGPALDSGPRGLLLNSPMNPSGAVLDGDTIEQLVARAERNGTTVLSDEIYHGLSYGATEHTVLEYTDEAFVFDGFSKRYGMTGWRLGWMVAPPDYVDVVTRLAQNILLCAPNFVQDAGVAALETSTDHLDEIRETYRSRRDLLLSEVEEWGLSLGYTPNGAYYLLVDVSDLPGDALDIADLFLEEAGVAMTPGVDFGDGARDYLRLSYATSEADIREASRRVQRVLETVES